VPQIHAATLIGQAPERYGFAVTPEHPLHYEQIAVPKATTLRRIAALAGIPLKDLERLNSALRHEADAPRALVSAEGPTRQRASAPGRPPARSHGAQGGGVLPCGGPRPPAC